MTIESHARCTVCGRVLNRPLEHGKRHYCDTHFGLFFQDTRPLWRASLLTFGYLALSIVGLVIGNQLTPNEPENTALLVVGIFIALSPALVWLILLYQIGARLHFEISSLPVTLFILAALIAAAAARPFLHDIINLDDWLARSTAINRFVGNILINGFTHSFALYATIRYIAWDNPAFMRRTDGVMLALAASLGYASALNVLFVIDQGGLTLLNGGLRLVAHQCAFLSSGLILGYFLGLNRFEDMPFYHLSVGLALAAITNGILLYVGSELNNIRLSLTQHGFSPWPAVAANGVILVATFAIVYGLMQRQNALTKARLEQAV